MRDLGLMIFFIASIPFVLKRPSLGIVMWIWFSVMNPHRLAYGFAYDFQFALLTALVTFAGLVYTKEERRLELTPPVTALLLFSLWICITSLFPLQDGSGHEMWLRVMKIFLMTFVALAVIHTKNQIHWVLWTVVFSLGFYGAKGGLFVLLTGGSYLVWGPEGSFINGNNEVALALVIAIPLMRYVQLCLKNVWQRRALLAVMLLTALAAIGSHSRGALLAIVAMATVMWWKSRNKFVVGFALVVAGILMLSFMPAEWFDRMNTIKTYDEDSSAMGRINAWWMAFHIACDRVVGGGFDVWTPDAFARYAPNPIDWHAAHSIYFQVMGEHGFIGLFLYMAIGAFTWTAAGDAKRKSKGLEGFEWVAPMMEMTKVSMIGFGVGGAFLSLAYFDVPYYVMVIVVATKALVLKAYKTAGAAGRPGRASRADVFGVVPVTEEGPQVVPGPARGRRDDWRGQGAYARPVSAFDAVDAPAWPEPEPR